MLVESWIHVEIDRETDRADLKEITADLRAVLSDVRESVEDWTKMRAAAQRIADELAASPPSLPEQETGEAVELLRWLADDHFTFLGYREYELTGETGRRGRHGGRARRGPRHRARHPALRPGAPAARTAPTRDTPGILAHRRSAGCPPTPAPRPASTSC